MAILRRGNISCYPFTNHKWFFSLSKQNPWESKQYKCKVVLLEVFKSCFKPNSVYISHRFTIWRKPFGRNEVGRSFSFGLAAMQPFFDQKHQQHCNFHYEIAIPTSKNKIVTASHQNWKFPLQLSNRTGNYWIELKNIFQMAKLHNVLETFLLTIYIYTMWILDLQYYDRMQIYSL